MVDGDRSTGPPLRAAICSGDSPRRRQSLIASSLAAAAGSSASIPRLAFGAVTNLCDATSALTVEGDLPSSLAISLHDALRSSILWTVSRSCLVSLP